MQLLPPAPRPGLQVSRLARRWLLVLPYRAGARNEVLLLLMVCDGSSSAQAFAICLQHSVSLTSVAEIGGAPFFRHFCQLSIHVCRR